jgi:hypothetical protein
MDGFETRSVKMEKMLLVRIQAPGEDIDRLLQAITAIVPLAMGHYDSNAYQSAPGIEIYRPLEGAAAGAETEIRKRPGTVELSFEFPDDEALAALVVEAVFEVHSYQEPVIRILPMLTSRSKGLDDSANPHRWWNTVGDWKTTAA